MSTEVTVPGLGVARGVQQRGGAALERDLHLRERAQLLPVVRRVALRGGVLAGAAPGRC